MFVKPAVLNCFLFSLKDNYQHSALLTALANVQIDSFMVLFLFQWIQILEEE